MKYSLVLQFGGDSLADYDAMIALENRLIADLGRSAEVDGHDCGSGQTNIFILTSDPFSVFLKVQQTLKREGQLEAVTAAYRAVDGKSYTILWPKDSQVKFTIT